MNITDTLLFLYVLFVLGNIIILHKSIITLVCVTLKNTFVNHYFKIPGSHKAAYTGYPHMSNIVFIHMGFLEALINGTSHALKQNVIHLVYIVVYN